MKSATPRTITSLNPSDECLVLRFQRKEHRDAAWASIWGIYDTEPAHFEKRRSNTVDEIIYSTRHGRALGEHLIIKAPTLCSDTWHCVEFKELRDKGLEDIDRVQYHELASVTTEEPLSSEDFKERLRVQAELLKEVQHKRELEDAEKRRLETLTESANQGNVKAAIENHVET